MRFTKIFLLLLAIGFITAIVIDIELSNQVITPSTIANNNGKITNTVSLENTTFSQVMVKKFEPSALPETNIEAIATSNAAFLLQVCAKNPTEHYDSLDILRGSDLLTHFDLMNNTDFVCSNNFAKSGDKISITTVNVSGVTTLIVTLKTAANATASIINP